jgi:hypothetical protein
VTRYRTRRKIAFADRTREVVKEQLTDNAVVSELAAHFYLVKGSLPLRSDARVERECQPKWIEGRLTFSGERVAMASGSECIAVPYNGRHLPRREGFNRPAVR